MKFLKFLLDIKDPVAIYDDIEFYSIAALHNYQESKKARESGMKRYFLCGASRNGEDVFGRVINIIQQDKDALIDWDSCQCGVEWRIVYYAKRSLVKYR